MNFQYAAPRHGGRLHAAAEQFNIPLEHWLDLSTGINPFPWQPKAIPLEVWQRLPDSYQDLERAAQQFYGVKPDSNSGDGLLAIPGSQWAIQTLPALFSKRRVWVPRIAYEEHAYWWRCYSHQIVYYDKLPVQQVQQDDVVIAINPNNPSGHLTPPQDLLALAQQLQSLQGEGKGYVLVDEAFMDATPEHSLFNTQDTLPGNLIVLRSVGKFFGLAGLRLGFVQCNEELKQALTARMGPWAISHPAAYVGEQALLDRQWQQATRQHLQQSSAALKALLGKYFSAERIHCNALFCTLQLERQQAQHLFNHCARNGVLLRLFEDWDRVRIGLMSKNGQQRLISAIECWDF